MEVEIKFRAKSVYGDIVHGGYFYNSYTNEHYIVRVDKNFGAMEFVRVNGLTVRQLCGYTSDGQEVYTGDEVIGTSCEDDDIKEIRGKVFFETRVNARNPLYSPFLNGRSGYTFKLAGKRR